MSAPAPPLDPDAIVAATVACPLVADMSAGVLGEVAVYLPGRRIRGLRLDPDGVQIHVVGVFGPRIIEIIQQVRAAVAPLTVGQQLTVLVDDLADPVQPKRSRRSAPQQ